MDSVAWTDRYSRADGRVFLTGMQAIIRLLIDKQRHDGQHAASVNQTFITGYEGSPLGGLDLEVVEHLDTLNELGRTIHQSGINEKTAISAVLGSQYAPSGDVDAFWYGKAHGTQWIPDETWLANLAGSARHGSMVLLCGEDHRSKSSVSPGTSDWALRSSFVPTFYPSSVAEIIELGMHAIHLSRWLGVVTAMKLVTPVCDGGSTIDLASVAVDPQRPLAYEKRFHPIVMALGALPMQQELVETKGPLVEAYLQANDLNRTHWADAGGSVGIITTGKSFVDVTQALDLLDLRLPTLQLRVSWPLDKRAIRQFAEAHQLETIYIVEEPGPFVEEGVKAALLGSDTIRGVYGAWDESGAPLIPSFGEVDPEILAQRLSPRLRIGAVAGAALERLEAIEARVFAPVPRVTPMSCGGCPYNTYRDLRGEKPGGAIGCSSIRAIEAYDHGVRYIPTMGAGGSIYSGTAPFNDNQHIYQYLGDGSYFHSGRGAIQSCVQGEVNITFLLLFNGAVALTGGQQPAGQRTVGEVVGELLSLGVGTVGVVGELANAIQRPGVRQYSLAQHEQALDEFRQLTGTTVIILDKECATQKGRRHRRQGISPSRYVLIDEEICEGCGDCYRQSEGCAALYRVPTPFGDKTQVRQSSCDQDGLCIDSECPSFVQVIPFAGSTLRRHLPAWQIDDPLRQLSPPLDRGLLEGQEVYTLLAVGRGGTGVVTISHVLAYAAMLEGLHVYLSNNTGLAQKGGPVEAPMQFSRRRQPLFHRLLPGSADLYLGYDLFRAAEPMNLRYTDADRSVAVVSTTRVPTAEQNRHPESDFPVPDRLLQMIGSTTKGTEAVELDTYWLAERLFGDTLFANTILLGAACQAGALPVSPEAIEAGLEFNGKQVTANVQAFRWGRLWVSDRAEVEKALGPIEASPEAILAEQRHGLDARARAVHDEILASLDLPPSESAQISRRLRHLIDYQDESWARKYAQIITDVRQAEGRLGDGTELTMAVACSLHQLMTYKDEYEVARLICDGALTEKIAKQFEGTVQIRRYLHPPILRRFGVGKFSVGVLGRPVMALLSRLRRIRGRSVDPFRYSDCRRLERELIEWYIGVVVGLVDRLNNANALDCARIGALPQQIRGFELVKIQAAEEIQRQVEAELVALDQSLTRG